MQLIANDFKVPEYNDCNTEIVREAGQKLQPRTYVIYFPLINMNPAEPDTILTTMHMVNTVRTPFLQMTSSCSR